MALLYKFKKELLENGMYVNRPRILVELRGDKTSILVPALIDSGCDTTVIPEGIANALGLDMSGNPDTLYAYRERNEVIESKAIITFLGKEQRQTVTIPNVPILIAKARQGILEEEDITLGINGIFDVFDITFKKTENKIIFKKSIKKVR